MSVSTDRQVRRLRELLKIGKSLKVAAMRADMDEKTARKYRESAKLPSEIGRLAADVADSGGSVRGRLGRGARAVGDRVPGYRPRPCSPGFSGQYPGRFQDGQLRTLQRRLRQWRATAGPAKEVFFAQIHHPGSTGGVRLHAHGEPGRHPRRPALRPHGLSLRADLLELGDGLDLFLGELREPQRGVAGGPLGTWRCAAAASLPTG